MKPLSIFFATLLYFLLTPGFILCQSSYEWSLANEIDGIQIYTRSVDDYQIKETKIETSIDVSIESLYTVLIDFGNQKDWLVDCKDSELIASVDSTEYIYYVEMKAPWPVMNRDLVAKGIFVERSDSLIRFEVKTGDNKYKALKSRNVRMPMVKALWQLAKEGNSQTRVLYMAHGDPGGAIPAWMINTKLTSDPIKTLKRFFEVARKVDGVSRSKAKLPHVGVSDKTEDGSVN